jgi:hypothetical protein
VYIVKEDTENNSEELRYSLRSLKNVSHDKVIIVGEKPAWVKNVTHIPVAQTGTKGENSAVNTRAAASSPLVSEEFIFMNDDFFILKPMSNIPALSFGLMADVIAKYEARYSEGTPYIINMKQLYNVLLSKGFVSPLSYELHVPMVLSKSKILELYRTAEGRLYQFRSYYGNYSNIGGKVVDDVKIFLNQSHNHPEYVSDPQSYLQNQSFLSATGGAFKRGIVGTFIRESFAEPSPYEEEEK